MISAVARRPPVSAPAPAQPNLTCPCLSRASVPQETGPHPPAPLGAENPTSRGLQSTLNGTSTSPCCSS
eukprot:5913012-Prymnesium_polylepis.1